MLDNTSNPGVNVERCIATVMLRVFTQTCNELIFLVSLESVSPDPCTKFMSIKGKVSLLGLYVLTHNGIHDLVSIWWFPSP